MDVRTLTPIRFFRDPNKPYIGLFTRLLYKKYVFRSLNYSKAFLSRVQEISGL
jgi:hypothetical protein